MEGKKNLIIVNELEDKVQKLMEHHAAQGRREVAEDYNFVLTILQTATPVEAIPIAVIKKAIAGIDAADQCDQAGRYDFELRNALQTVLKWYGTPLYQETEKRTYG